MRVLIKPKRYAAHFTGIGFDSINKSWCKGIKRALISSAFAKSPAKA